MQTKTIARGEGVSYGHLFIAPKDMQIAVLPIGYGEGLSRQLFGKLAALIQGREVPVVGQVCMNHILVDVTGMEVRRGEEAVIIGTQKDKDGTISRIRVADIAARSGLSAYELVSHLGKCLPKIYNTA